MTEHEKAVRWRERLGLSQKQLAVLTGYAYETIRTYESGMTPPRTWSTKKDVNKPRKIEGAMWQRYKRACHSVDCEVRVTSTPRQEAFQW